MGRKLKFYSIKVIVISLDSGHAKSKYFNLDPASE